MSLTTSQITQLKDLIRPYRESLYQSDCQLAKQYLKDLTSPGAQVHLSHPFNTLENIDEFIQQALEPLFTAFPDLERRDAIPEDQRERPAGSRTYNGAAKRMQQALIERWGTVYA